MNNFEVVGGVEYVAVNGIGLDKQHMEDKSLEDDVYKFIHSLPAKKGPRVMLLHMPMYRGNDLLCGNARLREGGHVTYVSPDTSLNAYDDVLSQETSQLLLKLGMCFVRTPCKTDSSRHGF